MSFAEILDNLRDGTMVTLQVTVLTVTWGTVVAVLLGLASLTRSRLVRSLVRVYVEIFRGVSAIILLFWIYFALPHFGIFLSPLQAGVLALGINLAAYGAELVRGAVRAVPKGQTEAAIAVNLSAPRRTWSVILPQATVAMLPPYGNLVIEVMKASALVSLISLQDLTYEAQNLRLDPASDSVEIFTAVLIIYFAIALGITAIVRLLERRFGRGLDVGRAAMAK